MKYDETTFLSPKDLSKILHFNISKIYAIIAQDDFPKIKVGRQYIIPSDKFAQWVEHNMYKSYEI